VLTAWAEGSPVRLLDVFNDRARSLPDVWNATFATRTNGATVRELVTLGEQALRTAELSMSGWGNEQDVRRLLRDGDVHAVLGWPESAVLSCWPAPPGPSEEGSFAADVCAFANGVRGGTLLLGVDVRVAEPHLVPVPAVAQADALARIIHERVFPPPEGVVVRHLPLRVPEGDGSGIVVVTVPAQDRLLQPFLLHSEGIDDQVQRSPFELVERTGDRTTARSVAAVHSAVSAGAALLRGPHRQDLDELPVRRWEA
jgi:hypothetical protein